MPRRATSNGNRESSLSPAGNAQIVDICMVDDISSVSSEVTPRRFILGIDYGTTNSSASYVVLDNRSTTIHRGQVRCIHNYPGDPQRNEYIPVGSPERTSNQVPSDVWYPDEDTLNDDSDFEHTPTPSERAPGGMEIEIYDDQEPNAASDPTSYHRIVPDTVRYGFEAEPSTTYSRVFTQYNSRNSPIKWAKLQLAKGRIRAAYPIQTRKSFYALRQARIVRKELDFITDFMTRFLEHVKSELQTLHKFNDQDILDVTLCVPAAWESKESRDMYAAMRVAMRNSGLGTEDTIRNLFAITEPEAAANFVLSRDFDIAPGDTFVLLDAGGGTVDAVTYTVTETRPLRLEREEVPAEGELCGSSFLNVDFRAYVMEKLKGETNLGPPLESIVDNCIMKDFEHIVKRRLDFQKPQTANHWYHVPNLRGGNRRGFRDWGMRLSLNEYRRIFEPRMNQVVELLKNQISKCREAGINVNKIVLVGGYGDSPALQAYLAAALNGISLENGLQLKLKTTPIIARSATAVSSGAVIRSFNKDNGPRRKLRDSYGVQRKEEFDRDKAGHRAVSKTWFDPLDGERYVKDTIFWVFKRGEDVGGTQPPRTLWTEHTFPLEGSLIFEEVFYVSDTLTESHWQMSSSKNKGKFDKIGRFSVDLTSWRDAGLMQRKFPEGKHGKEHWSIEFDIVMEIVGVSINCWASYPSSGGRGTGGELNRGKPVGRAFDGTNLQFNILGSFEPGTT